MIRLRNWVRASLAPVAGRLLAPGALYYLLMLAAFLGVFLLIPLTIFRHSGEDWRFQPVLLLGLGGIGLLAFLGAALIVRLVAAAHARTAAAIALALFCLGLFAIGAHVYAPVAIGPLDGSEIVSPEPLIDSAIELVVLVVLLFCFRQLLRGRGLRIAGWSAGLLLVITGGYLIAATGISDEHSRKVQASNARPPLPGNVYQIVLDTFQTDAFFTVLEHRPELRQRLQGFRLFPNNVSNYTTTRQSAASYFTSTLYTPDDQYSKWLWSWRNRGQFKELAGAGYQIWMYAPFGDWDNQFTSKYWHNVELYEQKFGFVDSAFYDFLQIWLLSLTPNVLTNEAVAPTAALGDRLFKLLANREAPLSIERGVHPYAGMLMLQRLADEEARRPADGQYVYAHAALPHGPFIIDRDCRYRGLEGLKNVPAEVWRAYLDQGYCAVALVERFLDRLVELGRYDAATIIIHADTGHGLSPAARPQSAPSSLGINNGRLLSEVSALLMVKRPSAGGDLALEKRPVQLVDVFPTLLDVLKLRAPDYPLRGRSLYRGDGARRPALFGLDPKTKHGSEIIELRIEDPSDLTHSPVTVLGPASDPATWSGQDAAATGSRPAITLREESR